MFAGFLRDMVDAQKVMAVCGIVVVVVQWQEEVPMLQVQLLGLLPIVLVYSW